MLDARIRCTKLYLILAVCLAASPTSAALAQDNNPLSPAEAVRIALDRNNTLLAADAEAGGAAARYKAAQSTRYPSLSGSGSYTRLSDNIPDPAGAFSDIPLPAGTAFDAIEIPLDNYALRVQVTQPLFTGFQISSRIEAARRQSRAQALMTEEVASEVAFHVRRAYWGLYLARSVREVASKALEQATSVLDDVLNRRNAGLATESDVLAVRTRVVEARLDSIDAENNLKLSRLALNSLMGVPLDTEIHLTATPESSVSTPTLDELLHLSARDRPQLNALRQTVGAMEAGVDAARGSRYPQVGLTGRYLYARPNPYDFLVSDEFLGTWEAGVSVTLDLWTWGRRKATVEESRAALMQVQRSLAAADDSVRLDVTRRFLEFERAASAIEVAESGEREAEAAYRAMQNRYDQGLALTSELLAADLALRNARLRLARSRTDLAVARAGLWRARGLTGPPDQTE